MRVSFRRAARSAQGCPCFQRRPSGSVVPVELLDVVFVQRDILTVEGDLVTPAGIEEDLVVDTPVMLCPLPRVALCVAALPDDLVDEIVLAKNLVQHHLHVMRGVPVAVVVEAAGLLEDAGELDAAGPHVVDVGLRGGVAVFEGPLLLGLAPEDFVVAVGVERRIDVDQVDAGIGQLGELFEVVAAVDDAGVEQGRRFTRSRGGGCGCGCGRGCLLRHAGKDKARASPRQRGPGGSD